MFKSTVDFKKSPSRPSKRHKFSQASHKKCLRREELKKNSNLRMYNPRPSQCNEPGETLRADGDQPG